MVYTPSTDFVGLWRAVTGGVAKVEMPGLDFVVSALGRSGLLNISVSSTEPVASEATTAWFEPASPSYSAEGALQLWDAIGSSYEAATTALLMDFLAASASAAGTPTAISNLLDTLDDAQGSLAFRGASGWEALAPGTAGYSLVSAGPGADPVWFPPGGGADIQALLDDISTTVGAAIYRGSSDWTATTGGAVNTVLTNASANVPSWGTITDILDAVLSNAAGAMAYRGPSAWTATAGGAVNTLLVNTALHVPAWATLSALLDAAMGSTQNQILVRGATLWGASTLSALIDSVAANARGDILFRNATVWTALAPGTSGQFLKTNGAGADPAWATLPTGTSFTNALVGDVTGTAGDTTTFFDGPTVAQGSTGTFLATGSCYVYFVNGGEIDVKLWDGTTVIASGRSAGGNISLSGIITSPAGNIRMSMRGTVPVVPPDSCIMKADISGIGKGSVVSAMRLA